MKVLKFLGNLIGVLLSIVVSLALLVTLIAAPVVSGISEMVRNESLLDMTQTIFTIAGEAEPSDPAPETPSDPTDSVTSHLPISSDEELVIQLLETELAEKLVDMYMDEFMAASLGDGQMNLSVESVKTLVDEHMHEILPLARQYASGDEMSDQEIEDAIFTFLDESGQEMLDSLPAPKDVGIDEDGALVLSLLRGNLLRIGLAAAVAVLSILILLFRFPRFKGFMWLAVVYILGGLPAFGVGAGATAILPQLLGEEPMLADILEPAMVAFSRVCNMGGVIMLVLAVVFILIFAFGRKALKKRKARKAAANAPAASVTEQAAPAVEAAPAAVPSYVTKAAAAAESAAEAVAVETEVAPVVECAAVAESVTEVEGVAETEPEL